MASSRSERTRAAVLAAAWDLFAESGLRALTMEAVAARAGVAKTTVYRWWPTKNAVVLDALHEHMDVSIGFPDTGAVRADVTRQVRAVIRLLRSPVGAAYLALVAESQHDAGLAAELRERYLRSRRADAGDRLRRAVADGELAETTDVDLVVDLVYGAVYYRFLVSHDPPPLRYADQVVAAVLGTPDH